MKKVAEAVKETNEKNATTDGVSGGWHTQKCPEQEVICKKGINR